MKPNETMPSANRGGRSCRNDLILIGCLLAAVVLGGLALYLLREEGASVTVTVDGKPYGTYALSEELTLDIRTGDGGEQLNRLIIREGEAFVETATCPDGICAAHKPISRDGESIVCLPHRVVITVESADAPRSDKQPDVVS